MSSPHAEFWAGVRAELPILLGVVPFGLIYGVLALEAGMGAGLAQSTSAIIFAGSAQFILAQLLGGGAPGLVVVATGAVVNLRHILYSASVAPFVQHLPRRWKWLLAYLLTDEAYAVAISRLQRPDASPHRHWYYLGAGLTLWATWQASTALGIGLGAALPASWPLDFAVPLTFIALVVPALRDRAMAVAAAVGGGVALLAAGLPLKLGLLVAALVGIAAGVWVDGRQR